MSYNVRRAGDGGYYLVTLDERGDAQEVYVDGSLVKFDTYEEAKEYIISDRINLTVKTKKRRF